jgi:3-oxoacyl-[acyl-carrier protein] reductase
MDLTGRVALITGASSGIGRATAVAAAARGMRVALSGRRVAALEAVADQIVSAGGEAFVCAADLTSPDEIGAMVAAVRGRFGVIDVLIASAGQGSTTPFAEIGDDEIASVIEANLTGVIRCVRAVVPEMTERENGHVILLSSVVTGLHFPGDALYAATKAGVLRFGEGLAREMEPFGIWVSVVLPGIIDTPLNDGLLGLPKADVRGVAADIAALIARPRRTLVTPGWYRAALAANQLLLGCVDHYIARRLSDGA